MSGKQKGGKSISSLPPIEGRHYLFKRGGRSLDRYLAQYLWDFHCARGIAAVSLNFDVSPYLANALHLVHTRDTAVRCSSPFSSRFHRLQISTKITKGGEGRLGNQQRILDLEFHDTSLFSSWESSSLSHYFSSFENRYRSSLNYSQLNGRFVFILKISIKSWLEKFRVEVFLFFLR